MNPFDNLRGRLMLGVSMTGSLLASYGRAFAGNCTLDGAGTTYQCSGAASGSDTTITINLGGNKTAITTAPGFGLTPASGDGFDTTGSGSFTDNNARGGWPNSNTGISGISA
jgi:hypothetical protein